MATNITRPIARDRYNALIDQLTISFSCLITGDVIAKNEDPPSAAVVDFLLERMNDVVQGIREILDDYQALHGAAKTIYTAKKRLELTKILDEIQPLLTVDIGDFQNRWIAMRVALKDCKEFIPTTYESQEAEDQRPFAIKDGTHGFIPYTFDEHGGEAPINIGTSLDKFVKNTFKGPKFAGDGKTSFVHFWNKFLIIHRAPLTQITISQKQDTLFDLISEGALNSVKSLRENSTDTNYRTVVRILCTKYGNPDTQIPTLRLRLNELMPSDTGHAANVEFLNEIFAIMNQIAAFGEDVDVIGQLAWDRVLKQLDDVYLLGFFSQSDIKKNEVKRVSPWKSFEDLLEYSRYEESTQKQDDEFAVLNASADRTRKNQTTCEDSNVKRRKLDSVAQTSTELVSTDFTKEQKEYMENLIKQTQPVAHGSKEIDKKPIPSTIGFTQEQKEYMEHLFKSSQKPTPEDMQLDSTILNATTNVKKEENPVHPSQTHTTNTSPNQATANNGNYNRPYQQNTPRDQSQQQDHRPQGQHNPLRQDQNARSYNTNYQPDPNRSQGCWICDMCDHRSNACPIPRIHRHDKIKSLGKCTICLRKTHQTRDCQSGLLCSRCKGNGKEERYCRHHHTICRGPNSPRPGPGQQNAQRTTGAGGIMQEVKSLLEAQAKTYEDKVKELLSQR